VAGVFSLSTIVTMPAQDAALTATCVGVSNGTVKVAWTATMGFYFSADPNTGILGPVSSGKSTIAQLMYSPDNAKDNILPGRAGAVNDVVWDTITLTEAGGESQWAVLDDSTVRTWTNGYVYALIFQDNNVQSGDWYFSTPLLPLVMATNIFPQSIEMNTDMFLGDAIDGVYGARVIEPIVLTVNSGNGSGTYTNGQQVAISANAPASGKVFDKWTGDTAYVANSNSVSTTVTMPASNIAVLATYKSASVTLTASAGAGGTVSPTNATVSIGDSTNIVITASNYYRIAAVVTNGGNIGVAFNNNSTSYTLILSNQIGAVTVTATFVQQVVTNPAASGANVPYSWMAGYGLTNSGATFDQAAVVDHDGDGLTAWQEYIAGTDPTNTTSGFKAAQATRNVITWSPVSGRVYSVYWSTNLVKGFTMKQDNILYPTNSYTNATPDPRVNHYQIKVRME
jgi:hypothetical protein